MSKQSEIREGMYNLIESRVMNKTLHTGGQIDELVSEIQSLETEEDVVIKTDKHSTYNKNYVLTESLIE